MSNLHAQLQALTEQFTAGVLKALRSASLDDVAAIGATSASRVTRAPRKAEAAPAADAAPAAGRRRKPGRLKRRTPEQLEATLGAVVAFVKKAKDGASSEQIQKALDLDRREVPRVLHMGLEAKSLRRKGEKRATRYFAK